MEESFRKQAQQGVSLDYTETPCVCGTINRRTRIVGGKETEIGKYPWMVAIKRAVKIANLIELMDNGGGTLVNRNYVISAAHCFVSVKDISKLILFLGDHDSSLTNEVTSITRKVSYVISHPAYDETTQWNDIAIVKLSTPVQYQWNIRPICLPPIWLNLSRQKLIIIGWGAMMLAGEPSNVLREATVPVVSNSICKVRLNETDSHIDDSVICAGAKDGSKDACQGDSGGPAILKCDGNALFVGIVSFGIGCGNPGYPGVYTRVFHYIDWITKYIHPTSLCGSQCFPE